MKRIIFFAFSLISTLYAAGQVDFPNPSVKIESDPEQHYVKSYVVSNDGKYRLTRQLVSFLNGSSDRVDGEITLSVNNRLQEVDGFGFAITGSTAYNLSRMSENDRKHFLTRTFSRRHGYGCSYVRIPIGCSDFSLSQYTCCDRKGIENFGLTEEETRYIIPMMKEILAINPDVKVISTPWTAPLWMKTNGWWTGGNLSIEYYQDYATYFVKWIQAFKENGIDIYAVTPQNEPLNTGNSASMYMSWWEARDFIKNALGPKIRQAGLKTKIYVYDHNYNYDNNSGENHYPSQIYADKEASQYVAGAAYHNYGGHASEMTYIHDKNPEKELIFTEWTAGTWSWPGVGPEGVTTDAQALIFDVLNNWGRGALVWNLLLDSDRGPFRPGGCETANGAADINKGGYNLLTYNSFYYVMCVASSAISENARYIGTSGSARDIQIVAFENTDGYGAVIMNTSNSEKKIKIRERSNQFVATLPPNSIASYRW